MLNSNFFQRALAFLRRDMIVTLSYKAAFLFDLASLLANLLIFFFIARLFGNGPNAYLTQYGGAYFPFILIGLAFSAYQGTALSEFSNVLSREQEGGTLEAILVTPTGWGTLMTAGLFWNFISTSLRIIVTLAIGALLFHVDFSSMNLPAVCATSLLTLTSLAGLGLMSAGFLLIYKRGNPVDFFLNGASRFLGGVYFPVTLLPARIQKLSLLLPLTHGLEATRKAILHGAGISELKSELAALLVFSAALLPLGIWVFRASVKKAKRDGSLAFF